MVVDLWVVRYEKIMDYLKLIGVPESKVEDYAWVKQNIGKYCDSASAFNTLKDLKELMGY